MVRLGDLNLKRVDEGLPETTVPIKRFISHEGYDYDTKQNDIALIQLKFAIGIANKNLRPACLWQKQIISDQYAIASGWGYKKYGGEISEDLMKVKLDIQNNELCVQAYSDENYVIGSNQICAGVLEGMKDTCQGGEVLKFIRILKYNF